MGTTVRFKVISSLIMLVIIVTGSLSVLADELPVLDAGVRVTDSIGADMSANEYTVILPKAARVHINLSHNATVGDNKVPWRVTLLDSEGSSYMSMDCRGGSPENVSSALYLGAGTYTVKVACPYAAFYNNGEYTIWTQVEENTGGYEIENNNTKAKATEIVDLNFPIIGSLWTRSDVDYYKVSLDEAGSVSLSFNHPEISGGEYWNILMSDEEGETVLEYSSVSTASQEKSVNTYLDKGMYYICVKSPQPNVSYSNADYMLTVNYRRNYGQFETEPNDTSKTATLITTANKGITGSLFDKTDSDYYRLSLIYGGEVAINFTHENIASSAQYWEVSLYSGTGRKLISEKVSGSDDNVGICETELAPGIYYIRVHCPYNALYYSGADYTLSLITQEASVGELTGSGSGSSWAEKTIRDAIDKNIVPVSLQGNYQANISREKFCELAMRTVYEKTKRTAANILSANAPSSFSDTASQDVLAARALGIVNGVGDNRFNPGGSITREEAAVMVYRMQGVLGRDTNAAPPANFIDAESISSWAVEPINYIYSAGIMTGIGSGRFNPKGLYTIEQAIVTFYRVQ